MPNIEQAGKYLGYVTNKCVTRSKGGFVQLEADCEVHEILTRGVGFSALPKPQHIKAFLMLTGNNGINSKQVDSIKSAFDWSGKSLKELQEMDVSGKQVGIVIEATEGQNATKYPFTVSWINSPSRDRSLPPADLDALDNHFRDLLGVGTEAPSPMAAAGSVPF